MQNSVEENSKLDGSQFREKLSYFKFSVAQPIPVFLTNVKLSVLNFLFYQKTSAKKLILGQFRCTL